MKYLIILIVAIIIHAFPIMLIEVSIASFVIQSLLWGGITLLKLPRKLLGR